MKNLITGVGELSDGTPIFKTNITAQPLTPLGTPQEQFEKYLEACFEPDDHVGIVTQTAMKTDDKGGKAKPHPDLSSASIGKASTVKQAFDKVKKATANTNGIKGSYTCVNPVNPSVSNSFNPSDYTNMLIEIDKKFSREQQVYIFTKSGLPIKALVDSGNKSLHAIVKVDAETEK